MLSCPVEAFPGWFICCEHYREIADTGGRYLGDMWILHLDSLTWEAVTPKPAEQPAENGNSASADPPPALVPSAGHAMAAWGSKLLIVGGHMKVCPHLSFCDLKGCRSVHVRSLSM